MEPLFCPFDLTPGPLESFRNVGVSNPWFLGWGDDSISKVLCLWVSMIHIKIQLWWHMPVIQGSENKKCKVERSVASWWVPGSVRDRISKYKVERSRGSLLRVTLCPHTHAHTCTHSQKQKFFEFFLWISCENQESTMSRQVWSRFLQSTALPLSYQTFSFSETSFLWRLCAAVKSQPQEFIRLCCLCTHMLPLHSWCPCWCLRIIKCRVDAWEADPGTGSDDALWGTA